MSDEGERSAAADLAAEAVELTSEQGRQLLRWEGGEPVVCPGARQAQLEFCGLEQAVRAVLRRLGEGGTRS